MAQDVRFLFMASRIGGELERIADQAINICQNARHVLEAPAAAGRWSSCRSWPTWRRRWCATA